jgi:hypothetical protein
MHQDMWIRGGSQHGHVGNAIVSQDVWIMAGSSHGHVANQSCIRQVGQWRERERGEIEGEGERGGRENGHIHPAGM